MSVNLEIYFGCSLRNIIVGPGVERFITGDSNLLFIIHLSLIIDDINLRVSDLLRGPSHRIVTLLFVPPSPI